MSAEVKLSASRIKTFQSCSQLYYAKYVLRLPDKTNNGALMGTGVHAVFECLTNLRHKDVYDAAIEKDTIDNSPVIARYVRKYIKKYGLPDECYKKMDEMILVGLKNDFFCKGGELMEPELSFDISSEYPKYRINGFLDRVAKYQGKWARIQDFKSSKKQFEGKELTVNPQAMIYSLASKKLWPELTPVVDFIFLQFPENPIQRLRFNDEQLKGFEFFLSDISKQMEKFDSRAAVANLAARQQYPKDGSFGGPNLCGRGKVPGQLKKNGEVMWGCSYKFPFDYYAICNQDGETIKTSFEDNLVPDKNRGQFKIKKRYAGCPHFNRK